MMKMLFTISLFFLGFTLTSSAQQGDIIRDVTNIEYTSEQAILMPYPQIYPAEYRWTVVSGNIWFSNVTPITATINGYGPFVFIYYAKYSDHTVTFTYSGNVKSKPVGGGGGTIDIPKLDEPSIMPMW